MRLLVVMTHYPFPPLVGSTIVAFNSIKHLSKHHAIDFVCLQPQKSLVNSPKFVERVELVPQRNVSRPIMWWRYLFYMLAGIPSSVSAYASKDMRVKVKDVIFNGKYDAVLLFEMSTIQYCPPSCYSKLIVNIEDPQSIKLNRLAELSIWSLWDRAKLYVLARLSEHYENRLLPRMAKVLLLSAADMNDMRERGGYGNLAYIPYGVEQRSSTEIADYEDREKTVIFSGSMYHPPNIDGALFLLNDIFPLVLQEFPSAVLWIVGADPDARIYEAAAKFEKQVVITGRVNDVAGYIKRATVSICPVRLRIGVQTKILEALSWGTPVVTTSAGNRGIGGDSGLHLWVEDDPYQLAKRIVELLQGHEWTRISEEGRKFATERFSWEGSAVQLERHLESLIVAD
ncbi:MAG: glycosyltransferase [Sulfuricellaceae bacterium]|nr:glycosyltransferase [Sulfuricellaceae bacterium]